MTTITIRNMVDDVRDFQKRMLPQGFANETAGFHTQENMEFREAHMKEELEEMAKARSDGDFVSYVDAHIDLIYVAFGSLLDMGVPIEKVWGYVHNANMKKEAGPKEDRPGGTVEWDIYKPEGWTGPEEDIKACLEMHGYEDEQPQLKLQLVQKR